MTALSRFARLLGLPAHQAEDALHSERAARAVLSRRSFFAASGAMVAGTGFSFGVPDTCLMVEVAMPYDMWRMTSLATAMTLIHLPTHTYKLGDSGPVVAGDAVAVRVRDIASASGIPYPSGSYADGTVAFGIARDVKT